MRRELEHPEEKPCEMLRTGCAVVFDMYSSPIEALQSRSGSAERFVGHESDRVGQ